MAKYYTPPRWANALLEGLKPLCPKAIIDPAMGDGSLLQGSATIFPEARLFGIDIDRVALRNAKATVPKALVSRGNALNLSSVAQTAVWQHRNEIDVVVANPPFSGRSRRYQVEAFGRHIECGVAAAHLVLSMEFYRPNVVGAIMPRSFFHAHRDRCALDEIGGRYNMKRAYGLSRSAFARGRASSDIVYFFRRGVAPKGQTDGFHTSGIGSCPSSGMHVHLVRGGMPCHVALLCRSSVGLPFVHTKGLLDSSGIQFRVSPAPQRGAVSGIAILLPRVGVPKLGHLRVREFSAPVQLSDCVLALCFESVEYASAVCVAIRRDFKTLLECWAGTGAPYTTVSKVRDYLARLGLHCRVSKAWFQPEVSSANGGSLPVHVGARTDT